MPKSDKELAVELYCAIIKSAATIAANSNSPVHIPSAENEKSKSARFSSTSSLPYYDTTLRTCDCNDFQQRRLPCKHIYRLAVELDVIEIIKRSSFNKELVAEVKNSSDIDSHLEQLKRKKNAMDKKCAPTYINFDDKTASFSGSGKNPYTTTLETCTCRDYFVRRLPCKHIYRLRYELNRNDR